MKTKFNLNPYIIVKETTLFDDACEIVSELRRNIQKKKVSTVVFDYYHGVDEQYIFEHILSKLDASVYIASDECKYGEEIIYSKFKHYITDSRTNGVCSICKMEEFFNPEYIKQAREKLTNEKGLKVVYGVGASTITTGDLLIYCDIEMEEIKNRYRNGLDNWGAKNYDEEFLRKEKRFMFMESRVQDWHKRPLLSKLDYYMDCNLADHPKMVNKEVYDKMIQQFVSQPFQCVPFFSPGVWGGHWLQEKLGADPNMVNSAWGMIGIMEFQSVQAKLGDKLIKVPGKNVYFQKPLEFLGGQVFYHYGYKVPLTMDILDTWGGQNLSLQCHPTAAYNHETFNFPYGHCESYYILDATDDSAVYLGTKDGVEIQDFVDALKQAQQTGDFDDTKWVNRWPMKKHDHIYIPSGTVHCSAANTLVLEINTFWVTTFKLWDWGRVDFDGKPRPIDIEHGENVIQSSYNTTFVKNRLISKRRETNRGDGWIKEHSGLMEYEPLHVERYWFEKALHIETNETVKLMCLVEGKEAIIISPNDTFEPYVIHYAEPIFIPANVGQFYVKPYGESKGKKLAILEVYQDLGSRY